MRVLYDHQTFSLQQRGGISRYFCEIIPRVSTRAVVSLFMGFHINEYGLGNASHQYAHFSGRKVPFMPHTLTIRLSANAFLLNRFADRIDYDIYHQTYFYDVLGHSRGRRIVTVYDMIYELYPQEYDQNDPTARNKAEAVRKADAVICISESTRQDLISILQVPKEKTRVVHLANSLNCEVIAARLIPSPYILYVGKRGGYKNFDTFLRAFSSAAILRKQFDVVCFGGGPFTRSEIEAFTRLDVSTRVKSIEGSDEVLANLYKYAAVLIYPSQYEGFGIPPLEAMHYGCPVVASKASSIPEVVGGAGLFCDPSSADDITQKLEAAIFDSDVRSRIIAEGFSREREFSWDRCACETLTIYEQVL